MHMATHLTLLFLQYLHQSESNRYTTWTTQNWKIKGLTTRDKLSETYPTITTKRFVSCWKNSFTWKLPIKYKLSINCQNFALHRRRKQESDQNFNAVSEILLLQEYLKYNSSMLNCILKIQESTLMIQLLSTKKTLLKMRWRPKIRTALDRGEEILIRE